MTVGDAGASGDETVISVSAYVHLYSGRERSLDGDDVRPPAAAGGNNGIGDGNCARVEVYATEDVLAGTSSANRTVFDEETAASPLCSSNCIAADGMLELSCTADEVFGGAARHAVAALWKRRWLQYRISYSAVGTGYGLPTSVWTLPPPAGTPTPATVFTPPPVAPVLLEDAPVASPPPPARPVEEPSGGYGDDEDSGGPYGGPTRVPEHAFDDGHAADGGGYGGYGKPR